MKIVWNDPSEEVTFPRKDFKSLNRRVIRRKWLIRVIAGTITSMVALGIYVLINLSDKPKPLPETPNTTGLIGPISDSQYDFDWTVIEKIDRNTIKQLEPDVKAIPAATAIPSVKTKVEQEEEKEINEATEKKDPIKADSLLMNDQVLGKKAVDVKDSIVKAPVNTFVPSEFVRAYPEVGYDSLYRYLTEYINKELLGTNNEADTLKISFAIEIDGRPSGINLSISTTDSVFMRIEEVVQQMPAWRPATADGQPIKTRFRLPLIIQSKTIKED